MTLLFFVGAAAVVVAAAPAAACCCLGNSTSFTAFVAFDTGACKASLLLLEGLLFCGGLELAREPLDFSPL